MEDTGAGAGCGRVAGQQFNLFLCGPPELFSPAEDGGEVGNKGGRQNVKTLGYWRQKSWAGYISRVQVFLRVQLRIPGCVSQLPVTGAKEPELNN